MLEKLFKLSQDFKKRLIRGEVDLIEEEDPIVEMYVEGELSIEIHDETLTVKIFNGGNLMQSEIINRSDSTKTVVIKGLKVLQKMTLT